MKTKAKNKTKDSKETVTGTKPTPRKTAAKSALKKDVNNPQADRDKIDKALRAAVAAGLPKSELITVFAELKNVQKSFSKTDIKAIYAELKNQHGKSLQTTANSAAQPDFVTTAEQTSARSCGLRHPYRIHGQSTFLGYMTDNGPNEKQLANFTAKIVEEITFDDGFIRRKDFKVQLTVQGGSVVDIIVPAASFAGLDWVLQAAGCKAILTPGQGARDHMRTAIQCLSDAVLVTEKYGHTGWRNIGGEYYFLSVGGAISAKGYHPDIVVELSKGNMEKYCLPPPTADEGALIHAIRSSMRLVNLGPKTATVPLFALTYRAPLNEILALDVGLFYSGLTGSFKSALTALSQAHCGRSFNDRTFPGNWSSTGNSLEYLAAQAKDMVFFVDDFVPNGAASDIQKYHRQAERLYRGLGNQAGRNRMLPDGKLNITYVPRSGVGASGEEVPSGASLNARILNCELVEGDIKANDLTGFQKLAADGVFAMAMSSYVQFLADKIDELRVSLPKRKIELRDEISLKSHAHRRTSDNVANLLLGIEMFASFAIAKKAITNNEAEEFLMACRQAFGELAIRQQSFMISQDPKKQFFDALAAAIVTGKAHVADARTGHHPATPRKWGWKYDYVSTKEQDCTYNPVGEKIGWLSGDELWLEWTAAYAMASNICRAQNTILPLTKDTLLKRMVEAKIARKPGKERKNVHRLKVEGQKHSVAVFPDKNILFGSEVGEIED